MNVSELLTHFLQHLLICKRRSLQDCCADLPLPPRLGECRSLNGVSCSKQSARPFASFRLTSSASIRFFAPDSSSLSSASFRSFPHTLFALNKQARTVAFPQARRHTIQVQSAAVATVPLRGPSALCSFLFPQVSHNYLKPNNQTLFVKYISPVRLYKLSFCLAASFNHSR